VGQKKRHSASFLGSDSWKTGFSVSAVKIWLMKTVLNLKGFLITLYMTFVNVLCELMIILKYMNESLSHENSTITDMFY